MQECSECLVEFRKILAAGLCRFGAPSAAAPDDVRSMTDQVRRLEAGYQVGRHHADERNFLAIETSKQNDAALQAIAKLVAQCTHAFRVAKRYARREHSNA